MLEQASSLTSKTIEEQSPHSLELKVVQNVAACVQAERVLADGRGTAAGLLVVVLEHLKVGATRCENEVMTQ